MMFLIVRKWLIHQPFYQQPDASVIASVIAGIVALCLDLGLAWLHPGYREVGATLFICSLILAIVQIGWQLRNLSPWRGYLPLWRGEWLFSLQLILLLNLLSWTLPVPNRYQLFLASAGIVWIFLTPVLMLSFPYPSGVLQGCWRLGRIAFILSQVTALGILSLKMLGLIYGGEFPSAPLFLWPCIFLGNAGLTGLSVLGRLGCPHPQGMVTAREQEALQRLHVIVNHIILRLANGLELLFGPRIIKKFQKAMARRLGEEDFSLGDTMFTDASRLYTQEELAAIIIEAYLILKAWYGTAFARNSLHNVLLSVSDEDLCLVKTQLFAHKPDFWQQIANRPASCNLSRKERISLLRQCFLLQPLSETQLSTVNSCFHEITLENGSVWVTSGDVLESFYIIARGAISLNELIDEHGLLFGAVLSSAHCYGWPILSQGLCRCMFTHRACSTTTLLYLHHHDWLGIQARSPEIAQIIEQRITLLNHIFSLPFFSLLPLTFYATIINALEEDATTSLGEDDAVLIIRGETTSSLPTGAPRQLAIELKLPGQKDHQQPISSASPSSVDEGEFTLKLNLAKLMSVQINPLTE